MKIAFDAKRALNNNTGLGNYARILLNALMRDYPDNEYLLFSPKAKDELFNQLQGDFQLFFPETKFQHSFHPLWRSFSSTKALAREGCDIYHGLTSELPLNIHRSASIKSVVTIHDLIFLKHTEQYPWFDRQFYTIKTKYAARHAHKIIAVSEETRQDLISYYKVPAKRIEVIYQSINSSFYEQAAAETIDEVKQRYNLPERYILNVGSFFPRKNQLALLRAFNLIKKDIAESIVLVGSVGDTLPAIHQYIAEQKLENRVHIITNATNADMPAIYQAANAFVFPSLFEGFGIPVLEALASRIPVIATKGGAIEEAAGKGSLLVNAESPEDIAEKILKIIKNDSLRNKMIEAGSLHAQSMNDKAFAQKTMAVYKEVLKR